MSACKIIFSNQKGGVGKTTTTVNLGASLAKMGRKVLIIDLDAQGNLTNSVSINPNIDTIYDVMVGDISASKACKETMIQNLYAIAGNINLAGLDLELVDVENREFVLKEALSELDNQFDYIFIDCPPSMGLVTMNAMVWADKVIVPMQCEYLAMEGLNLLIRTIGGIKHSLNKKLEILGIVFTMFSSRTKLANEVVADVSSYFRDKVFKTKIPRNVRLSEAPSHGMPVLIYDSSSKGSKSYMKLALEVEERV